MLIFSSSSSHPILPPGSPSPCPSSLGTPRKEVVCFYEGRRPTADLDPCLCTHLVCTDVGVDEDSRVHVEQGRRRGREIPTNNSLLSIAKHAPLESAHPTNNALLINFPTELRGRYFVDEHRLSITNRSQTCKKRACNVYMFHFAHITVAGWDRT